MAKMIKLKLTMEELIVISSALYDRGHWLAAQEEQATHYPETRVSDDLKSLTDAKNHYRLAFMAERLEFLKSQEKEAAKLNKMIIQLIEDNRDESSGEREISSNDDI